MKEYNTCNDCGNDIEPSVAIKMVSLSCGEYYEGKPLCDSCKDVRYEDAVAEYEYEKIMEAQDDH